MTFKNDDTWVAFHSTLSADEQIAWKAIEEILAAVGSKLEIQEIKNDLVTGKSHVLARIYK